MPRVKKERTLEEKLYAKWSENHWIYMDTISTECDMGDHIDVICSCGYKNKTYGSTYDVVNHVIEVLAKEFAVELNSI